MKVTPKNILKVLVIILAVVLQDIRINLFSYIPLFFLKWPVYINVIVIVLIVISSIRWEGSKFDKFFKKMSIINIPLNVAIWVMTLVSFINGTVNCNPVLFYVLFGINAFLTITKIPSMFKKEDEETQKTNSKIWGNML